MESSIRELLSKVFIVLEHKNSCVISLNGIIGVGKTTLISHLSKLFTNNGLTVSVVKECVDDWKQMLELFYTDKTRWAYTLQTVILSSRFREFSKRDNTSVIITERGPDSDIIFATMLAEQGHMSLLEFGHYVEMNEMITSLIEYESDIRVLVDCSIDNTMERIALRNRGGESFISRDYQESLLKYHKRILDDYITVCTDVDLSSYDAIENIKLPRCIYIPLSMYDCNESLITDIISEHKNAWILRIPPSNNCHHDNSSSLMHSFSNTLDIQEENVKDCLDSGSDLLVVAGGIFPSYPKSSLSTILDKSHYKSFMSILSTFSDRFNVRHIDVKSLVDLQKLINETN